jgi:hypothetical protein
MVGDAVFVSIGLGRLYCVHLPIPVGIGGIEDVVSHGIVQFVTVGTTVPVRIGMERIGAGQSFQGVGNTISVGVGPIRWATLSGVAGFAGQTVSAQTESRRRHRIFATGGKNQ